MGAIQGAIFGAGIALVLLFLWKAFGGEAAKSSSITPLANKPNGTHWNIRSVSLKMAVGAVVAAGIVGFSALAVTAPRGDARSPRSPGLLLGYVLFAAVTGALIGYFLALRDLVLERRSKGQRVHPVLRAYFCWGLFSVVLWCVTGFAAGIGGNRFHCRILESGRWSRQALSLHPVAAPIRCVNDMIKFYDAASFDQDWDRSITPLHCGRCADLGRKRGWGLRSSVVS